MVRHRAFHPGFPATLDARHGTRARVHSWHGQHHRMAPLHRPGRGGELVRLRVFDDRGLRDLDDILRHRINDHCDGPRTQRSDHLLLPGEGGGRPGTRVRVVRDGLHDPGRLPPLGTRRPSFA